jgi:HPt (histidine-containing phosphotransfer) domain-containing protein
VLDYGRLSELESLSKDPHFVKRLINGFIEDLDSLVAKIDRDAKRRNFQAIQDHAHAVIGAASGIGAKRLQDSCAILQKLHGASSENDIKEAVAAVHNSYVLTTTGFAEYEAHRHSASL